MTPTALAALYAILGCSIFGTASKSPADHGQNKSVTFLRHNITKEFPTLAMQTFRTNYDVNNSFNKLLVNKIIYDDIYNGDDDRRTIRKPINSRTIRQYNIGVRDRNTILRRSKRDDEDPNCVGFTYKLENKHISHPKSPDSKTYARNITCETIIYAPSNNIITLDFVDVFHIEDHPTCEYDFLEIRDGKHGYSNPVSRYCGETFPKPFKSQGPYVWLKFKSDITIEYEGFQINVGFKDSTSIKTIPNECYINVTNEATNTGFINMTSASLPKECLAKSTGFLDVLWTIQTEADWKIYFNFTEFKLDKPNECNENYVEVFGAKTDIPSRYEKFCGSMANSVITKDSPRGADGNIMHVHLFASFNSLPKLLSATYTGFRILNPEKDEKSCHPEEEFDCDDNTCIKINLKCDQYANCRLKADEDYELCKKETGSLVSQPHILAILVIFSLILSGMSFVFLFKCIRKLVQDHKIIREHIRQSCEDRLDRLDVRKLSKDCQPRASLERENHTNEMYKKQRSHSHHKSPSSIDSDYIQETQLDLDDDHWRRDLEAVAIETEEIRIENGRNRRSDISRKEDSIRKRRDKRESVSEVREKEKKREIRDVSVGVPDTKESGCQTRESLFQTGPASSDGKSIPLNYNWKEKRYQSEKEKRREFEDVSVGVPDTKEFGCQTRESLFQTGPAIFDGTDSGSNGQAFSTFGYSGATLVRPSPPAPVAASQITIELLKGCPSQDSKSKKLPDRRPMSSETTRSAPDVIIVSKPIR